MRDKLIHEYFGVDLALVWTWSNATYRTCALGWWGWQSAWRVRLEPTLSPDPNADCPPRNRYAAPAIPA